MKDFDKQKTVSVYCRTGTDGPEGLTDWWIDSAGIGGWVDEGELNFFPWAEVVRVEQSGVTKPAETRPRLLPNARDPYPEAPVTRPSAK